MPYWPDFNAQGSSELNTGRESLLYARKRLILDMVVNGPLGAHGEDPALTYTTGQIDQALLVNSGFCPMINTEDFFGRRSFTARVWFKMNEQLMILESFVILNQFNTRTFSLVKSNTIRATGPPVGGITPVVTVPTLKFTVYQGDLAQTVIGFVEEIEVSSQQTGTFAGTPLGGGSIAPPTFLQFNQWHRAIVWYDKDSLQIGLQLNNRTPLTATLPQAIPKGESAGFAVGSSPATITGGSTVAIDELGLWHDYVWSAQERTDDWAGGVGVGWSAPGPPPAILDIIAKRPMAYFRFEPADEYPLTEIIDDAYGPNNFPRGIRNKANPMSR